MRQLNLLPHRAWQRQRRTRDFYRLLIATLSIALSLVLLAYFLHAQQQEKMNARAQLLGHHTQALKQKIKALTAQQTELERMELRLTALERLQQQRQQTTRLLHDIAALIPPRIVLQSIRQQAQRVTLNGYADSSEPVARLMQQLRDAPNLGRPALQELLHNPAPGGTASGNTPSSSTASDSTTAEQTGVDFRIELELTPLSETSAAPPADHSVRTTRHLHPARGT
ncbi:PilN domain-containing protein [Herbaspirillum sp. RTI4]|uniref:PilN domain-containing protein n=1 Tax=Herbaspirillum sp. RTI4 TaxID=3048640 RepID=UPI002AB43BA6|nr:PilN domain-containing protein [Herbaspirillum sp. RTI4]MDY7576872.1 PilN domain-containing protein [Herbaspirillum sp. RTI4]MEA9982521.1 PilN domain-containing protein [Herbaspirillum sp. RTI4]